MNKPDVNTLDAADLFHCVIRALAMINVTGDVPRAMCREWLKTAGADEAERKALDILFDNAEG